MLKNTFYLLLLTQLLTSCSGDQLGHYKAEMRTMDNQLLPFEFKLLEANDVLFMEVENAGEKIKYTDIKLVGDSLRIEMPPYDAVLMLKASEGKLTGRYFKEDSKRSVAVVATLTEQERFTEVSKATFDIRGSWKTEFRSAKPYPAIGLFELHEDKVFGTFRTNTGDYRFLEGVVSGDSLKLSTFDGAHPYLVLGKYANDTLSGNLYYMNTSITDFWMVKDENYQLPDSKSLTALKEGYNSVDFEFKNLQGNLMSLKDPYFEDKVVVIQIMGSWCPNCLDETKFFMEYINDNPEKKVAFVGLSFESAKTEEKALYRVQRMVDKLQIPYPILLAQFGSSSAVLAAEKLPMLDAIRSYPTSIILDKNKKVSSIHTGFNGPATGAVYQKYKEDFTREIDSLLR